MARDAQQVTEPRKDEAKEEEEEWPPRDGPVPGSWLVYESPEGTQWQPPRRWGRGHVVISEDGEHVAWVGGRPGWMKDSAPVLRADTARATARLIAAAPQLLALLKRVSDEGHLDAAGEFYLEHFETFGKEERSALAALEEAIGALLDRIDGDDDAAGSAPAAAVTAAGGQENG